MRPLILTISVYSDSSSSIENDLDICSSQSNDDSEDDPEDDPKDDPEDDPDPIISPIKLNVKTFSASSLPVVSVMNARSLYNKAHNISTFLKELGI